METEIIFKDCIKPPSPTPRHLKNHKLSLLDLYIPPYYYPLVLYYPLNQDQSLSPADIDHIVSTRLQVVKQSLSEILSRFYPFAGKTKDSLSIDCNDEGIYFVRAQVRSPLNEFLNHPDTVLVSKFLPDDGKWIREPTLGNYVIGVQVTTFSCGGIAIGACVSHMIADGTAFSTFLKSWVATAHKNNTEEVINPMFDAWSLFPQNDAYPREACSSVLFTSYIKFGRYVTRRFVFDSSAIANLKDKAISSGVQNPTRFEVVTALLSKCIMAAIKARSGSDKPILLNHAVNLRRRATQLLSKYHMGNFIWLASALCNDKEAELHDLVNQLREAISKLDGDFVNGLQGDEGLLNFLEAIKYESETYTGTASDQITITSWCNFGLYDIDFGWGKPAWASIIGLAESTYSQNLITLMDTRLGNGVEAWVYLPEEDMATLELDKQLLEFATMDPSPLKQGNLVSLG